MKAGAKADFDAIPFSQFCHVKKEKVPIPEVTSLLWILPKSLLVVSFQDQTEILTLAVVIMCLI